VDVLENDFGLDVAPTFIRGVLAAVGHYGEVWDNSFPPLDAFPRAAVNLPASEGGLRLAPPFRDHGETFSERDTVTTIDDIRARGRLLCGSTFVGLEMFAAEVDGHWIGYEVDLCRAVAAAIFSDVDNTREDWIDDYIEIVVLVDRFDGLRNGKVIPLREHTHTHTRTLAIIGGYSAGGSHGHARPQCPLEVLLLSDLPV
jgi:hypothetical protein